MEHHRRVEAHMSLRQAVYRPGARAIPCLPKHHLHSNEDYSSNPRSSNENAHTESLDPLSESRNIGPLCAVDIYLLPFQRFDNRNQCSVGALSYLDKIGGFYFQILVSPFRSLPLPG